MKQLSAAAVERAMKPGENVRSTVEAELEIDGSLIGVPG